ncbi:hypothetical protein EDB81DRAFT_843544 [Dactylonectria macrodidyma]|uniref:Amino acid permease/ SLC12A domain-containing protein n=1 Tax=Dactylonectria macrodidyma TaxID=307937 RepID=A0A9P9ER84_9HYPO|nr:hypothetical protein EDB81DRAFT_843544 [Dactylonectria macrodidyma]
MFDKKRQSSNGIYGGTRPLSMLVWLGTRYSDGEFAKEFSRLCIGNAPYDTISSDSTASRPYYLLLQDYLMLSHYWGRLMGEEKKGFSYDELPRTFQDAVQSRIMEDVFTHAYCTIAASSARDSLSIGMQGIRGILTCACDFNKDVDEGPLLERAWFTKLKPPPGKQYFIIDPNFPHRLSQSGYHPTVNFIQFLVKKYSTSGLTFESNRDVTIYSLLERMQHALQIDIRYSIFNCYLNRTVPSWSWIAYPGGIDFILDPKLRHMVLRSADLDFNDDGDTLTVKALSGLANLFTWGSICLTHIRFRKAWMRHGHSLDEIPFKAAFGVIGSWFGLVGFVGKKGMELYYIIALVQREFQLR